ncbi:Metallo-dependent phosphatase [Exidia glandulosa HHB12029]|uniref:Metallo-dependent phosphatase n=1 Tax=Exidia glandulosa HHB12029 TaxID=1314781 RepID=A0A165GQN1_EXIGL|nr:Metallo-dependent phosphatase [Exidia glandulosa HHB12029]
MFPRLGLLVAVCVAQALAAPPATVSDLVTAGKRPALPDFSRYIDMRALSDKDLRLADPTRRIIFVGDVHGMVHSLHALLDKISYDPTRDVVVHTGDIITKGADSLGTLEWLSSNGILGVRGNQDQKVIEWRGWIEWVLSQKGGRKWLDKMERKYPDGIPSVRMKTTKKSKKFPIPEDWEFNGEHYQLARNMADEHYQYLLGLPLNLHLVPLHTFVGHAGVLPMDPTRSPTAKRQPLAHVPEVDHPKPPTQLLRLAQEIAVMREIPQNTDPWTKLNVRSILDDGEVTRDGTEGVPWSNLWNAIIDRCGGFESTSSMQSSAPQDQVVLQKREGGVLDRVEPDLRLPCHPASVVYGHAASRGLDLKRWTKGLDTGCVYGKKLTALIVGGDRHRHRGVQYDAQGIEFGENGSARLASVDCELLE